ncbi:MAG: hypothetical protein R2779_04890 [Crocinitomicaceae bacterium]
MKFLKVAKNRAEANNDVAASTTENENLELDNDSNDGEAPTMEWDLTKDEDDNQPSLFE